MRVVLSKKRKFRYLCLGRKSITGKNYKRITIYHRGGANKRYFRFLDYMRYVWNLQAYVVKKEYEPNKRVFLNLLMYTNGILSYNIAVRGVSVGDKITTGGNRKLKDGDITYLLHLQAGIFINNVELFKNSGGKYCRSLGTFAKIISMKKKKKY